ncbi:MAG: exodeoxyribonuclease VII large subunit [Syntrophomonadaceae bacterium]|nr:exodeoxyribonuclease VII large subunit [Syntrophomonadaceae bacterium]
MQDYITVGMLNTYITRLLDHDAHLQNFWLKGEISGFRFYQQSGHSYFTLKDEEAAVSCVMFRSRGQQLNFKPEEGMEVLLRGYVSVFARQGKYQVYVEEMQLYGTGGLYLYLEQLKARLAAEGYFAPERKKEIPRLVHRVGVVTSQDGAALHDIMRVIRQRHPGVEVILSHSSVQGPEAPRELAQAVQALNDYGQVDIIIVGRGGGSLEDLMAFNSEELVQAIYHSRIPIISGVGHEVDYSLSDLAADLRAATPTQAAQLAVPDYSLLYKELAGLNTRMMRFMQRILASREERLDRCMMKKVWREPGLLLRKQQNLHSELEQRLKNAMDGIIKDKNHHLALAAAGLDNLSPLKVMGRGYAILSQDKKIIKDISDIEIGDELQADLANGRLQLLIKGKEMTTIGQT